METLQPVELSARPPVAHVPPFHLVTVVWGRAFTRNYLDLVLPTQLSPGNLPALAGATGSLYKIYTTTEDAAVIRADRRFAAVGRLVPTQMIEFAPSAAGLNFDSMIVNHRRAIIEANAAGAAFIALSPDAIFSDGSFAALLRLRAAGKRLVLVTGLRANQETFAAALRSSHQPTATGALTLPPRELMRLALENLHPISRAFFWDSPNFIIHPANLYWWVRAESPRAILARCFHLHPVLVDPARKDIAPTSSIDDDYIHDTCPDPATHHVVTDSDEIACVELSQPEHLADLIGPGRSRVASVAKWCVASCNDTHLKLVDEPILLHAGAPPDFSAVRKRSLEAISAIRRWIPVVRFYEWLGLTFAPVLRWRGWLLEREWRGRHLHLRNQSSQPEKQTYQLDACRPSDLIAINGNAYGPAPLHVRFEMSDRLIFEKSVPPGHFRWVLPAPLSYGPTLRFTIFDGSLTNRLILARIGIWRTVLHHLRHDYRENRPDPLWLEWAGLQPGHRLEGPCAVRVIPHHGVTHLTLELQTVAGPAETMPTLLPAGQSRGAAAKVQRQSITLPLDPRSLGEPVRIDLPGAHWLLAVSCREKRAWRAYKEFFQTLSVVSAAVFTRAGWRRLLGI